MLHTKHNLQVDLEVLDAPNSVAVTAYNENGGVIFNTTTTERDALEEEHPSADRDGRQFVGFATSDGTPYISGVTISLVGREPYGFFADNVIFTYSCCTDETGLDRRRRWMQQKQKAKWQSSKRQRAPAVAAPKA